MTNIFTITVDDQGLDAPDPAARFVASIVFHDEEEPATIGGLGATPQASVANLLGSYPQTMADLAKPAHQAHPLWAVIEAYADAKSSMDYAEDRGTSTMVQGAEATLADATRDLATALADLEA